MWVASRPDSREMVGLDRASPSNTPRNNSREGWVRNNNPRPQAPTPWWNNQERPRERPRERPQNNQPRPPPPRNNSQYSPQYSPVRNNGGFAQGSTPSLVRHDVAPQGFAQGSSYSRTRLGEQQGFAPQGYNTPRNNPRLDNRPPAQANNRASYRLRRTDFDTFGW